ncbi:MAG TPA: succinylglutamate-semialdehyde dehydrogenase [Tepidisphaeraceae bacterium]|jgi:succinylglutamic semialdehyde dehydrogenase
MSQGNLFINGKWEAGQAGTFQTVNPADGEVTWQGNAASNPQIDRAIESARKAQPAWEKLTLDQRIAAMNVFQEKLKAAKPKLVEAICCEIGKAKWEATGEVDAMIGKMPVSISAYHERRKEIVVESGGNITATRFKPHGVVAVFGPFNFPGHLPNGHIVPALLAGNTVVFKPSELSPLVAEETIRVWESAGLPPGVINLVQGGREVGQHLSTHAGIDGLFFTGSVGVGKALRRALADSPNKILALELGGNNPLIVHETADIKAAAYNAIQSAFITSGQRCTCARRLIVPEGSAGDQFIAALVEMTQKISVGPFTNDPEPFMGPVVSDAAGNNLLAAQKKVIASGGKSLIEMRSLNNRPAMLTPGIIDVTNIPNRPDEENFGPLLQIIRVKDFDAAILEANHTAYGLSAGLLSDNPALYEQFRSEIRAGVVNWNRPTTGASGALPFGGVGLSGNHRPSGYYAVDYCSYPIASMETASLAMPAKLTPGISGT